MAVVASCFIIENTFVSTLGPDDEEKMLRRRSSWPLCNERSFEILADVEEEEPEMKGKVLSTSTFDGENYDCISMSPCPSSGSSASTRRHFGGNLQADHAPPTTLMQPVSLFCFEPTQQQQQQHEEEAQGAQESKIGCNDSSHQEQDLAECDTKHSTKLKSSALRPSKTTRVKCKAVAKRAIDAAMETGSPDDIQALVNLAAQTPYMRSLLRHALEQFEVGATEK